MTATRRPADRNPVIHAQMEGPRKAMEAIKMAVSSWPTESKS